MGFLLLFPGRTPDCSCTQAWGRAGHTKQKDMFHLPFSSHLVMKPNVAVVLKAGLEVSSSINWPKGKSLCVSVFNEVFDFTFPSTPSHGPLKTQTVVDDS